MFETNSVGERHRVRSRLTGRTHHYLSRGEVAYHYVAELAPRVLDIREQYPIIPVKETLKIAKALKVRHPYRGSEPFEVTIDLMLSVDDQNGGVLYVARSVKPSAELEKPDVQARLALECAACRSRGIPWKLVTESLANSEVRSRGRWLFKVFKDFPDYTCDEKVAAAFIDALSTRQLTEPLRAVIVGAGKACGLPYEEAVNLFKFLVCTRRVRVDLSASLALKDPHPALAENFW